MCSGWFQPLCNEENHHRDMSASWKHSEFASVVIRGHVRSKTSWGLWRGWSVQWRQRELSTWALQLWKQNAIEQNAVENRVSSKLLGTLLQSTGAWYSNISEWQVASSVLKGFGRNTKVHVTVFLFPGVNYCLHNSLSVNCINCSSE